MGNLLIGVALGVFLGGYLALWLQDVLRGPITRGVDTILEMERRETRDVNGTYYRGPLGARRRRGARADRPAAPPPEPGDSRGGAAGGSGPGRLIDRWVSLLHGEPDSGNQ